MKRKFKLIASILSLTTSMVFLAFGIYAAANKTATISSSVTFTGESVYATVEVFNGMFTVTPSEEDVTTSRGSKTFTTGTTSESITGLTAAFNETNKFYAVRIVVTNTKTSIPFTVSASKKADLGASASSFAAYNNAGTPAIINNSLIVNSAPSTTETLNATKTSVTLLYIYQLTSVDIADITLVALKNISVSLTRI